MRSRVAGALVALLLVACEPIEPCDEYVDYMCACHAEDASCDELSATYSDAGAAVQDECAVLLDEQEAEDLDAGLECPG